MKRTRPKLLLATGLTALGLNLTPQSASAATTSGAMTVNETWSGTVSLVGDVTVLSNVTLTILPGTKIQCDARADNQNGGINTARIELIVNGVVSAVGSAAQPILFTSWPLAPTDPGVPGDWYGIRLANAAAASTFSYCALEYGIDALSVGATQPVVRQCTFRQNQNSGISASKPLQTTDCLFESNGYGIISASGQSLYASNCLFRANGTGLDGQGGASVALWNCSFYSNSIGAGGGQGHFNSMTLNATGCIFTNNPSHGLFAGSPSLTNCLIAKNGTGIEISWGQTLVLVDATIRNSSGRGISSDGNYNTVRCFRSSISQNGSDGIWIRHSDETVELVDSIVSFNGGGGVAGEAPIVSATNSTVINNATCGIVVCSVAPAGIRRCIIKNNGKGIYIYPYGGSGAFADGLISNNDISENSTYELENSGAGNVYANGNYWGEPTTTELLGGVRNLTKIYDSRDNASVGQVFITSWLSAPPGAEPPTITSQPQDQTVPVGGTASFSVTPSGMGPINYQWRRGLLNLTGKTNSLLTLNNVQTTDGVTNYNVIVANSYGSVTSRWATLTVLIAPAITSQPANLFLPAGATAVFHVTATGSTPLSYQWQKNAANQVNGGRISGATTPDLTITSIQASDVGDYRCVVTNAVGTATSSNANLSLPTPPSFTQQPATQVVGVGAPATFSVTATGSPPMNYQWYLNGSVIGGANDASFSIAVTTAAWLGSYQVQVWNSAGTNWSATAGLWLDELRMYAGVNVYGPAGSNCVVQYATNLTAPVTWMPLQSVIIVTNPTVIIDYDSPEQPKRFYRTVPQ